AQEGYESRNRAREQRRPGPLRQPANLFRQPSFTWAAIENYRQSKTLLKGVADRRVACRGPLFGLPSRSGIDQREFTGRNTGRDRRRVTRWDWKFKNRACRTQGCSEREIGFDDMGTSRAHAARVKNSRRPLTKPRVPKSQNLSRARDLTSEGALDCALQI